MARALALALLALALCLFPIACGDSGPEQSTETKVTSAPPEQGAGQAPIPKGVPPAQARQIQTLRERFPRPEPQSPAEAKAIEAGEAACEGKTPLALKEELYAKAKANLSPAQQELIEQLPDYEERASRDLSFAAGQLGAAVYEASLPVDERQGGFRGCVHSLARGLEGRLGGNRP